MNTTPTPEQEARRQLEERFTPGYFVRHTITQRMYFIADCDDSGCQLIQAVRGNRGSVGGSPYMTRNWEQMERGFEGGRV